MHRSYGANIFKVYEEQSRAFQGMTCFKCKNRNTNAKIMFDQPDRKSLYTKTMLNIHWIIKNKAKVLIKVTTKKIKRGKMRIRFSQISFILLAVLVDVAKEFEPSRV